MTSLANVTIDPSIVEGIIRAQIETSLLAALGNDNTKAMVLDGIVKAAMKDKVDESGRKADYSSYNKHEFLTVKVRQMIQQVTNRVFEQWLKDNEDHIAGLVRKSLEAQAHEISNGLVRNLIENSEKSYRTNITVSLENDRD